jgi:hypothetical protein
MGSTEGITGSAERFERRGYERENEMIETAERINSVVHNMPVEEYHSKLALSNSAMKDLLVSPLHYWHWHLGPMRATEEPTPFKEFGTALHYLVLQPQEFYKRYACGLDEENHPGALHTIEDIRNWIKANGHTPKGTKKSELILHAQAICQDVQIWDVMCCQHKETIGDSHVLAPDLWQRVHNAASALKREPKVQYLLDEGVAEVTLFDTDERTNTPLKARLDWLAPKYTVDFKTFSKKGRKSSKECVADAIYFEQYYRQAFLYATMRKRAMDSPRTLPVVLAFVESDPPHEVLLRELRPTLDGYAGENVYWTQARSEVNYCCQVWQENMLRHGSSPWLNEQEIEPLLDEELRGMAFAS